MILALLAGLLAFVAMYAHGSNSKLIFALASGISAGALMYLLANSSPHRKG
jgi:hypothetical protein